jgi:acyl-CoA thioester hydrolase
MTREQEIEITVRYQDCDPYRHLNTANYLRYMVECDLAEYEAAGHGVQALFASGKFWRARRCSADFLVPLYYGDPIRVTSGVLGVQDGQVLRNYEIYPADADSPAAKGEILWEYADMKTGKSEPIPTLLKNDLFPGATQEIEPKEFPAALSTRPQGAYTVQRYPEWRDGGPGYHLSFTAFTDYFVYTTLQAAESRGWSIERSEEERLAYVVRRLWIDFIQPVFVWDELEIETWISNIRRLTVLRNYTLRARGKQELLAWGQFLYARLDMNSGKPVRFSDMIWQDFLPQISPDDLPQGN